ncbi:MAG: hypothetical protein M3P49_02780 [Actinomycetota bacterium]|nr:hypothetical protein [Actinomycetota bacterium]
MAKEERRVRGIRLHEEPVAGRNNKFVITEEGAWFLPFEDNTRAPTLAEMLAEIVELEDEQVEHRFEDGRILVGYVAGETREVTIDNWPLEPGGDDEAVKRRMKEIFPQAEHFVGADDERHRL